MAIKQICYLKVFVNFQTVNDNMHEVQRLFTFFRDCVRNFILGWTIQKFTADQKITIISVQKDRIFQFSIEIFALVLKKIAPSAML